MITTKIEIDVSPLIRDMTMLLHSVMQSFIQNMIISEESGFPQEEITHGDSVLKSTFTLFGTRYEELKKLSVTHYTKLPESYYRMLEEYGMAIIKEIIEKYFENK
jgi:DUF438 domain-containing protein